MAKLQPFNGKSTRADEIVRQAALKNINETKRKKSEHENYYGAEDSWRGSFDYEDRFGYPHKVRYVLKAISLEKAVYSIDGLSIPLEKDVWLVPEITLNWEYRYWDLMKCKAMSGEDVEYRIYKVNSKQEPTEGIHNYEHKMYGSNYELTTPEKYANFEKWKEHLEVLAEEGLGFGWNINRELTQHVQKYFKINLYKANAHAILLDRGVDLFCINSIKIANKCCYINYSENEKATTTNTVLSEKVVSNLEDRLRQTSKILYAQVFTPYQKESMERTRELNQKYPEYDHEITSYHYNFALYQRGEDLDYLISDGYRWFGVGIPSEGDHHIIFPPYDKTHLITFKVGENWQGRMDIDFYHVAFGRDLVHYPMPEKYRNTAESTEGEHWDIDSILFNKAYREQVRKELDPDYIPSGTGFKYQSPTVEQESKIENNWHKYVKQ